MIWSVASLQVELPPLGMGAVDRDLLERLDQFAGALQIGDQLVGGVAAAVDELLEPGAPQRRAERNSRLERRRTGARSSMPPSG